MRVAFYSHDSFGLGHLRRCLKLAAAIGEEAEDARGLIITGSQWAELFRPPAGFAYHRLLPVVKLGPGHYEARMGGIEFERALAARRFGIGQALEQFQPDILIVDNVPCGLAGELVPALERARRRRRPRLVLSLRDIVDTGERVREQWAEAGAYEALEHCYDEIWIFGNPDSCDPRESYGMPPAVAGRVVFCGHVGSGLLPPKATREAPRRRRPRVLVTGGGGGDAVKLVGSYAAALRSMRTLPDSEIILGPDFPSGQVPRSAISDVTRISRFCPNLPVALASADAVVSMAGYNTTCEILEAGVPAVFVPRVWPRLEQWLRARDLAAGGRAQCLHPETLTGDLLCRAVDRALEEPRRPWSALCGAAVAAKRAVRLGESGRAGA